jgi:hypothetical protein
MIRVETLPDAALDAVATQIGQQAHKLADLDPALAGAKELELGETFTVWTPRRGFARAAHNSEAVFEPIGYWHELLVDGEPLAYARSAGSSGEAPAVNTVGVSRIVARVHAAHRAVQAAGVEGDFKLRLVEVPFAYAHVFWLAGEREDLVFPVDVPADAGGRRLGEGAQPLSSFVAAMQEVLEERERQAREAGAAGPGEYVP